MNVRSKLEVLRAITYHCHHHGAVVPTNTPGRGYVRTKIGKLVRPVAIVVNTVPTAMMDALLSPGIQEGVRRNDNGRSRADIRVAEQPVMYAVTIVKSSR